MSSQVLCQQGNVKSIRSMAGIPRCRNGVWSSVIAPPRAVRERRAGADALGRGRAAGATARASEPASRGIRIAPFSATKSSSTSARISLAWRSA